MEKGQDGEYPRYMMATKASHKLGDISREKPDLCCIRRREGEYYIGEWVLGFGFIEVKFPVATTRTLTPEEKRKYNGMFVAIGSRVIGRVSV